MKTELKREHQIIKENIRSIVENQEFLFYFIGR